MHPAPTALSLRVPRRRLGQGWLPRKEPSRYRCYLPVLTGFAGGPSRRAPTFNATCGGTGQKEGSLDRGFDPT